MASRGIITDTNLPVYIKVATLDYTNIKYCNGASFGSKKHSAVVAHRANYGRYHPYMLVFLYMREMQKLPLGEIAAVLPDFAEESEYLQAELATKYNAAWVKDMVARFNAALVPAQPIQNQEPAPEASPRNLRERLRALCKLR